MKRHLPLALAALVLLAATWLAAFAAEPAAAELAPMGAPPASDFPSAAITRGAQLAVLGNCGGCHTAPDQAPYAGGVAVPTPFGTVYGSNITPDAAAGIGGWSRDAFVRAMRDGVARDGRDLYPAFPYDHFTHVRDADLAALYAFLMTRTPADTPSRPAQLHFPFGFRPLLKAWKLLFLHHGEVVDDPTRDADWNRGAYLVQAVAHCGACHTPRNAFGAERAAHDFDGGEAEGWTAPPLDARSPSPQPWTLDTLTQYLRTGIAPGHAIAGGPMQGVTAALADAPEADVRGIAVYVLARMGQPDAGRRARAAQSAQRAQAPLAVASAPTSGATLAGSTSADDASAARVLGASVYASACAACHDAGRGASSSAALPLPLAVALYEDDPRSLLRIVREGIHPPDGARGRFMPAFGDALNDEQLVALAAYLREAAAAAPPWPELAKAVAATHAAPATAPVPALLSRHDDPGTPVLEKGLR